MSKQENKKTQPIHQPDESTPSTQQRRRKKSRNRIQHSYAHIKRRIHFRTAFIFIFTVAVVIATIISVRITDAISKLDVSWQRVERVLLSIEDRQGTDLTVEDFDRIHLAVDDLYRQISTTQRQLRFVSPFINLNDEWKASLELLNSSSRLVTSTLIMLDGMEPVMNFLEGGGDSGTLTSQISSGERIVSLLEIGQGRFQQASTSLVSAKTILDSIDLTSTSPELILSYQQIESFYQQLAEINQVLVSSPDILSQFMGLDQEATYLILAQNNDEIRPSGGYVSAYGWFNIRNGRITDFDYSPSTATSPLPPNESFLDTFEVPDWWLDYQNPIYVAWDGSWYADFPSTAQLAMDYYNGGRNPNVPVDGVIAIDLYTFEQVVDTLIEVEVTDNDQVLTANNFRDVIYDYSAFGNQEHGRYLATIYRQIFEDWQNANQNRSAELLSVLVAALTQRHIMIYTPDEDIQTVIDQLGWSGNQVKPDSNDYLLVADTNLVNKSNKSIVRSLTYDVEIKPDQSLLSSLSVRYDYFHSIAREDPAINEEYYGPRDYKTLTQMFLPNDVTIVEEDNLSQSSTIVEDDFTIVVSRIDVDYDTSKQIQVTYEAPAIEDRVGSLYRYRLLIQKQPGSQTQNIDLQIKLPANASIAFVSPQATASYALEQPILDFRLQLISDQWIEVLYSLDS